MGIVNHGSQTLTFGFGAAANSETFNKLNYQLHQKGIYDGGLLSYINSSTVRLSPLTCFIVDSDTGNGVRIETSGTVDISPNYSTPYIVLRFDWVNTNINYMDVEAVASGSIVADDIVIGKVVYDAYAVSGTLQTDFDYTRRTTAFVTELESNDTELRVTPQDVPTETVYVYGGTIRGLHGEITVANGSSPVISATTSGRNDLVWINDAGAIQVEQGTDAATPVTPDYGSRYVIAEIHRGASRSIVDGHEIIWVNPPNHNMLYELSKITDGDGASLIGIEDAGTYFTGTTVEAALTEIMDGTATWNNINIDGGTIDGTTIGGTTQAAGSFTTLSITSFGADWTNAGRTIADLGIVTTVDIDGGTIDGTVIGGAIQAAGSFTTLATGAITTNSTIGWDANNFLSWETDNQLDVRVGGETLSVDGFALHNTPAGGGLEADNTILPTQAYVDAQIALVVDSGVNDASTTTKGIIEIATDAETATGTATDLAVTPANLAFKLAAPGVIGGITPATQLNVDNIRIDGNVISSTTGNITLTPHGTGIVTTGAGLGVGGALTVEGLGSRSLTTTTYNFTTSTTVIPKGIWYIVLENTSSATQAIELQVRSTGGAWHVLMRPLTQRLSGGLFISDGTNLRVAVVEAYGSQVRVGVGTE